VTVRYRPELDGLRGIAIALVLLQHLRFPGMEMGMAGAVGVALFFVLSGYLITSLLLAERERTGTLSLPRFYGRRARRLLPALIALLVVVGLVMAVQGRLTAYTIEAGAVLFYVGNWFPDQLGYLIHTWSLAVEEQFYILWPLVFLMAARWPRILLAVLVAGIGGSMVLRGLSAPDTMSTSTLTRGDALLWGCLLAVTRWKLPTSFAIPGWTALVLVILFVQPSTIAIGLTVVAVGSAVIVSSASSAYAWRPLIRLGIISYAVYLWHMPLAIMAWPALGGTHGWPVRIAAWLGVGAASIGLALVSERYIERPFRRRSRLAGSLAPSAVAAPSPAVAAEATQPLIEGAPILLPQP
jgi:peptidoglycan/LPS O-acetylase OafA/YrhL